MHLIWVEYGPDRAPGSSVLRNKRIFKTQEFRYYVFFMFNAHPWTWMKVLKAEKKKKKPQRTGMGSETARLQDFNIWALETCEKHPRKEQASEQTEKYQIPTVGMKWCWGQSVCTAPWWRPLEWLLSRSVLTYLHLCFLEDCWCWLAGSVIDASARVHLCQ